MPSNRRYPEKKCANPNCLNKTFVPHDYRQEYCTIQCRTDCNNDKRRKENNTIFLDERELRRSEKGLKSLYRKLNIRDRLKVSQQILELEGVNLKICVEVTKNLLTRKPIRWYYDYGLELKDQRKKTYEIHERNKNSKK